MLNVLKEILRELEEINQKLDRLENKNRVIGTKVNRTSRIRIEPIRMRGVR